MTTPKSLSRVAGVLYLLMIGAAFNEGYVLPHIVRSDAGATADNIRASATLFRLGFVGDLATGVLWLMTAMALYTLLKHVNPPVAAAMVTFAAVGGGIQCLNQLNQYTALRVASDDGYTRAFGRAGADSLTQLFAGMQHDGYLLDSVFFGLWLLPMGCLVFRSGYFPRVLGVLLIVGCFSYLVVGLGEFLTPGLDAVTSAFIVPAGIGEFAFMVWLLARGARNPAAPAGVPVAVQPLGV